MTTYTQEQEIDLHFNVLNAIGISIKDQLLVDQDTGSQLNFEGLPIVYSYDVNAPVFTTEDAIKLDLINNIKMATYLFGYFINKIVADPEDDVKEVFTFFQIDDSDKGASALSIKYESEEEGKVQQTSDMFYNNVLKYPALILLMSGNFMDLHIFDDPDLRRKK